MKTMEHAAERQGLRDKLRTLAAITVATSSLLACSNAAEATPPTTFTTATATEAPVPIPTPELPVPSPTRAVDCMVQRCIALTFDDGPGIYTEQLLDMLQERNAKATFFVVGTEAEGFVPTIQRTHSEGHQIGTHSWSHKLLTRMSAADAAADTERTNKLVFDITGEMPTIMRPPYGGTNQAIIDEIAMPEILWSIDPQDWKYKSSHYVANHIINHAHRGAIVLMHDIHGTTVDAVPQVVDTLLAQGYTLVTIDELLGKNLPPGTYRQQDI